jgi:hypothetical protein
MIDSNSASRPAFTFILITDVDKSSLPYGFGKSVKNHKTHHNGYSRQTTSSHPAMPNNNPAGTCAGGYPSHSAHGAMSLQRPKVSIRH